MIVDDESFNRMAIKIILSTAGVVDAHEKCDTANNGEMAVQMIQDDVQLNGKCSYNLIIMDQNMPIMDGCTATKQIRQFLYD